MTKMKCDYHVHSEFSDDSETPMKAQVEQAVKLGLDELCFTDHVDYGIKNDWDEAASMPLREGKPIANVNYPVYFATIDEMRQVYPEKLLSIKSGLEFGIQQHTINRYEKLYAKYQDKLDFILLSVYQINDKEFWKQDFQKDKSQEEYNTEYYEEILAVIQRFHNYSVLAHLDLLSRYDLKGIYPFEKVMDIIAEILSIAIRDGKGIELNTSSWHYGLKDTQPSRAILNLYRDLGGEIITLGSDAHSPRYLAANMDDAKVILRNEIGFRTFCTFEQMTPIIYEL